MSDLAFLPAVELARLVRAGEVSSRELVDLYLDRIEAHNDHLGAFVHLFPDDARRVAAARDEETAGRGDADDLPPFHGVPVSVKETSLLEGKPVTMGSRALRDFVAPFDDEAVARLKRAGMVPLGKTNVPELGATPYTEPELFGPARNPWNRDHTPGGSSGGGAAALAAGLCPVSQGSDGGGSLRIPASCTGLVGLKATRDRISNAPMLGDAGFGLVTRGALTRTVEDSAALLDVMAGYVPGDPGMLPEPERPFVDEVGRDPGSLTVGIVVDDPIGPVDAAVSAAVDETRSTLEDLGHRTVDAPVGTDDDIVDVFEQVWACMVASFPFPLDDLEPLTRWLVDRGHEVTGAQYLGLQFRLQSFCRAFVARFHADFDVLLAPVLLGLPLRVGATADLDPEATWEVVREFVGSVTPLANATGQPSMAVPLHVDADTDLPVGVQFVGRHADEATLIRLSAQLETARPWTDRRPAGF